MIVDLFVILAVCSGILGIVILLLLTTQWFSSIIADNKETDHLFDLEDDDF